MSQEQIYTKFHSHYDDDGDLIPELGNGVDVHTFSIPSGKKYVRYSIDVLTSTMGSGYRVQSKPTIGADGNRKIEVRWWYTPFGKIAYRLNVFAGEKEAVVIAINEPNWVAKAQDAIEQHLPVKLILKGPEAKQLFDLFRIQSLQRHTRAVVTPDPTGVSDVVIITVAIVVAVITVAAFATIAAVLLYAINQGCDDIQAKHKTKGPLPFDDELEISIKCSG